MQAKRGMEKACVCLEPVTSDQREGGGEKGGGERELTLSTIADGIPPYPLLIPLFKSASVNLVNLGKKSSYHQNIAPKHAEGNAHHVLAEAMHLCRSDSMPLLLESLCSLPG